MPMPAGYNPIGTGYDPIERKDRTFYLSDEALEKIETETPWKLEDVRLLPNAVMATPPTVAFKGLGRDGYTDAYCYASKPENPPQPGVFLVYFYDGPEGTFSGPVVFDWDWREEDPSHPCHPLQWEDDFGALLWRRLAA